MSQLKQNGNLGQVKEQYSELRFIGRKLAHDAMNGNHVNCPLVHKTSTPTFHRRTEEQNEPLLETTPLIPSFSFSL